MRRGLRTEALIAVEVATALSCYSWLQALSTLRERVVAFDCIRVATIQKVITDFGRVSLQRPLQLLCHPLGNLAKQLVLGRHRGLG